MDTIKKENIEVFDGIIDDIKLEKKELEDTIDEDSEIKVEVKEEELDQYRTDEGKEEELDQYRTDAVKEEELDQYRTDEVKEVDTTDAVNEESHRTTIKVEVEEEDRTTIKVEVEDWSEDDTNADTDSFVKETNFDASQEGSSEDHQAEEQSSSTHSSTPSKPPVRRAPKRKGFKIENLVEEAMSVLKKPDDECDTFARHVATELRAMNDIQRAIAKQQMSQNIFKGRMNQLSQYEPAYLNLVNCAPAHHAGYYSPPESNVFSANPQGEGISCAQPITSPTCSNNSNSNLSYQTL